MSYSLANFPEIHWPVTGRIRDFFNDSRQLISETLVRRKKYQQTVRELSRCSDRELNDFGIARSDIRQLARENSNSKQTQ